MKQMLQAPKSVIAADAACWEATVHALQASNELLEVLLAADASACAATLRDIRWDTIAVQQVMCDSHE